VKPESSQQFGATRAGEVVHTFRLHGLKSVCNQIKRADVARWLPSPAPGRPCRSCEPNPPAPPAGEPVAMVAAPEPADQELMARAACVAKKMLRDLTECLELASRHCESPIEVLLLHALVVECGRDGVRVEDGFTRCSWLSLCPSRTVIRIQPDLSKGGSALRFRPDLMVIRKHRSGVSSAVYVECDGHDWHDRTPEQALRDKSRDRSIYAETGVAVVRFTGREITRNADACAREVHAILDKLVIRHTDIVTDAGWTKV